MSVWRQLTADTAGGRCDNVNESGFHEITLIFSSSQFLRGFFFFSHCPIKLDGNALFLLEICSCWKVHCYLKVGLS